MINNMENIDVKNGTNNLNLINNIQSVNLLLIGGSYSDDKIYSYYHYSRRGFQFAAQTLQSSLIDGLIDIGVNLYVQSKPSLSSFPFGYSRIIVGGGVFLRHDNAIGHSIGFINVPLLRDFCHWKKDICRWYEKARGVKVAIVYSLNMSEIRRALWIKKHFTDVHIHVMIPDLPEYMGANRLHVFLGLKKRHIEFINKNIAKFDSYSMLTENIAEYLHIIDKPHIVIEGIYNSESNTEANDKVIKPKNETGKIAFLYTGGLNRRYGIVDLLEAFAKTMNNDFELWICGTGDCLDTIKEFAENDKRIKYFGTLPHDKVLTLQQQAAFVVNPRHSHELFIKYSFPSKTLEYMASGTPTLMCHLGCIPKAYEKHLLFFDDESIAGMSSKMEEVASLNKDELTLLGNGARQFILDYKNPKKQVERILQLIYSSL